LKNFFYDLLLKLVVVTDFAMFIVIFRIFGNQDLVCCLSLFL
jgi:hypothetical protein